MVSSYNRNYYLRNRIRIQLNQKRYILRNKEKHLIYRRKWYKNNRERLRKIRLKPEFRKRISAYNSKFYKLHIERNRNNPKYLARKRFNLSNYAKRHPLTYKLSRRLSLIKQRCINPKYHGYKYYGGKGIKCLLSLIDMKFMWERDRAFLMDVPSIDRINPDKNYILSNCRFLEKAKNTRRKKY